MKNNIAGRFSKVGETENSIIVGTFGNLTASNTEHNDVLMIAEFYGISTTPEAFSYHSITMDGVKKRINSTKKCLNNYNEFLEIFK